MIESPTKNQDIKQYLDLNLKMLSFIGMDYSLNNDRPRIKKSKFLQTFPIFMTNILSFTIAALEVKFLVFILNSNNQLLATQICSELLSNMLCISKSLSMATAVENIQNLLDDVSFLWTKYRSNKDCQLEIAKKARRTLYLSKCYLGVVISGVAAFGLPPIHHFVYHYFVREAKNYSLAYSKRVFLLQYPFEINSAPIFMTVLTEEWYLLLISSMYWVSCDTLFAQITTHAAIQFKILHYDVRTLINYETMEDHLKANVIILIKRHQHLLRVCKIIEDVFSPVILATVLLSALNMCVNAFQAKVMSEEGNHAGMALYSILIMILLLQILFYCSFAETLTNQTSSIAEGVYNCKWTEKNQKLRIYLQMIIMKSQNPFYCTAYGLFPIGHAKMASIINASFSYLMILQSVS